MTQTHDKEAPGIPVSDRIATAFRTGDASALTEHDVADIGDLVERLVVLMPRADGSRLTSRLFEEMDF